MIKSKNEKGDASVCYVVGASDFAADRFHPGENDYIIAADGGYEFILAAGYKPDLVIGDFDSASHVPLGKNIIKYPSEKDDTDMMLALKEGMDSGYESFRIFGGLGGMRISHTIANIQALRFLSENGCSGVLVGDGIEVYCLKDEEKKFDASHEGYVSVFSFDKQPVEVTLSGLKYELNKYKLSGTFPLGVSNEFAGKESSITVKGGSLLVILD